MAAGFILTAVLAYILESRAGAVQHQDWEFYATVVCLYLIFAFPCFVWRYFWHARNRE
ncbi:membrane protein [Morococcus cerebrosus]|uniref:Membrane protein n=1 Tax=Morococcus cerebrosus TaxID=1056807 RepID=A0A0C1H632_9NEIS|nr:membrane protein [Morococcus cerebrosus]